MDYNNNKHYIPYGLIHQDTLDSWEVSFPGLPTVWNRMFYEEVRGFVSGNIANIDHHYDGYTSDEIKDKLGDYKFFISLDTYGDEDCMEGNLVEQLVLKIYDIVRFFSIKTKEDKFLSLKRLALLLTFYDVQCNIFCSNTFKGALDILKKTLKARAKDEKDGDIRKLLIGQYNMLLDVNPDHILDVVAEDNDMTREEVIQENIESENDNDLIINILSEISRYGE